MEQTQEQKLKAIDQEILALLAQKYSKLCIASGLRCGECKSYLESYRMDRYLSLIIKDFPVNVDYLDALLNDLVEHIKEKHPDRFEAFIK